MKNKVEIIVLFIVILILTLYIVLREDKNINYTIPSMEKVISNELTKIDYQGFQISKSDGKWYLPSGYEASENSMNKIITSLVDLEIIDIISQSKDYERFGLDKENFLTLYNKEEEILKLNIGATSSTGNYTYIKFPSKDNVYSVRGDINNYLTMNEDELRSKVVLNITDITEITITKDGETKTLTESEFKEMEVYLHNLQADSFNDLKRENLLLSVNIKGNNSKTLDIYEPQNGIYPATSTDVDFPFTLPEYVVNKLIEL